MPDLPKTIGDFEKYADIPQEIRNAQILSFVASAPYHGSAALRGTCEYYAKDEESAGVVFYNCVLDSSDRGPHGITWKRQFSTHPNYKLIGPWLITVRLIYKPDPEEKK